jgi:dynein heavy chain
MKDRHWEAISEKQGVVVKPDDEFTFTTALDLGLLAIADFCSEMGERAAKEF